MRISTRRRWSVSGSWIVPGQRRSGLWRSPSCPTSPSMKCAQRQNLWTSSFVLVTAGWSMLALAVFYYLIDVRGGRRGAHFKWFDSTAFDSLQVVKESPHLVVGEARLGGRPKRCQRTLGGADFQPDLLSQLDGQLEVFHHDA